MKRIVELKLASILAIVFPGRLHIRSDIHLARKIWHMGMGLVIAFAYLSGVARSSAVVILGCILGLDLLIETMRLRVPSLNDKVVRYWGPFMRTAEINQFSGIPYYLAATILAIGIFPKPIAILSILYLACGDPIASFFGILYGRYGIRFANGKSLIGSMAGVAVCTVLTFVFLNSLVDFPRHMILTLTAIGGLAGGLAELLPLEVDDNFSIPIVAGFVLWLAMILSGV